MKKRPIARVLVLLAAGAAAYLALQPGQSPVNPVFVAEAPAPVPVATASPSTDESEAESPPQAEPLHLPENAQVREQVREDPHHTPPLLIDFARQMAERMESALKSQESAMTLFEELEDCVTNERPGPDPARALCLSNAEQLSKTYPTLFEEDYEDLRKRTPERILKLMSALEVR